MHVNATHEVSALYKYKTQDVQKAAEEAVAQVKALGGSGSIILTNKDDETGFVWIKDRLGMYHGEAILGGKNYMML